MNMNSCLDDNWQGTQKYWKKTCPCANLDTKNPTELNLGSNPNRRGGMTVTDSSWKVSVAGKQNRVKHLQIGILHVGSMCECMKNLCWVAEMDEERKSEKERERENCNKS